jgi:hypothetical protein
MDRAKPGVRIGTRSPRRSRPEGRGRRPWITPPRPYGHLEETPGRACRRRRPVAGPGPGDGPRPGVLDARRLPRRLRPGASLVLGQWWSSPRRLAVSAPARRRPCRARTPPVGDPCWRVRDRVDPDEGGRVAADHRPGWCFRRRKPGSWRNRVEQYWPPPGGAGRDGRPASVDQNRPWSISRPTGWETNASVPLERADRRSSWSNAIARRGRGTAPAERAAGRFVTGHS